MHRSLLVCLLVGCGAAPALAPTADRCVLAGDAEDMSLVVEGLPDLLEVSGLPAEASLREGRADVRVLRPLRFAGETEVRDLHLHVACPIAGRVAVSRGASVRIQPSGHVALDATVVLSGPPDVDRVGWQGIAVRMSVACDRLGLGVGEAVEAPEALPSSGVLLGARDVPLYDGPDGSLLGVLRVSAEEGDILRAVRVTEQRAGFAHLEHGYPFGTIDAWIDAARVGPTPMGWGNHGTSGGGLGSRCGRSDHHLTYRGPGVVLAGTEVVAEATGRVWGTFVEDTRAEVGVRPSGLVEVIAVEGLRSHRCGNLELDLAIVPSAAVRLP